MDENGNDFVQIRLWKDCINNCRFCYLKAHKDRTTTLEQKKARLQESTNLVSNLNAKTIGLIGGDFFEGQIRGCEEEWLTFMKALKLTGCEIYISANLIHEQYLLDETTEILGDKLLICTSYDEVGRFHTEKAKEDWLSNVKELHKKGIDVFCNCIATQDLFEENPRFPKWLGISLVDPHISHEWLLNANKDTYHQDLLDECTFFNFPKRKTAIRWFTKHPNAAKKYSDYTQNHSNLIYGFDSDGRLEIELEDRLQGAYFNDPDCHHPFYSLCYADSDKCMMCDAKRIAENAF